MVIRQCMNKLVSFNRWNVDVGVVFKNVISWSMWFLGISMKMVYAMCVILRNVKDRTHRPYNQ